MWEAIITFLLFPVTVLLAYLADKKLFISQFGGRRYLINKNKGDKKRLAKASDNEVEEFENLREQYMDTIKQLRKEHPRTNMQTLENMAITEVYGKSKKSRAFYKMMGTRMLTGGGNLLNQSLTKIRSSFCDDSMYSDSDNQLLQKVFFDPCHYTVPENVGTVSVTIKRAGGFLGSTITVDYTTVDDTALAGNDYVACSGTAEFLPYQTETTVEIRVVDDEEFEEDEHFSMQLSNLKVNNGKEDSNFEYALTKPSKATIMILDDDHAGIFYFESTVMEISESCGSVSIGVQRSTGVRGTVRIPYKTVDGSAKAGSDYTSQFGDLIFDNDESYKTIDINIADDSKYEKNEYFLIQLGEPELIDCQQRLIKNDSHDDITGTDKSATSGLPKLGEWSEIKVTIHENIEFKGAINKLLKKASLSLTFGASSWKEQFQEAISVNAGEVDENGQEVLPPMSAYILHYLTLFWKLLFACVPPTEYLGGWACFIVSVICIGFLTAILGDLASSFGCSIGLLDEVTAITFVAIGTSLPDTFASKVSAIHDSTADSSIGNVTGSNAVNVFLGLGVAWTIATMVHAYRGTVFLVPLGSLGFSVTVFCVLALFAIAIIVARRHRIVGGELGGPPVYKFLSGGLLFGFFLIYVVLSSLKAYCHL